jgi:hypothetical protein
MEQPKGQEIRSGEEIGDARSVGVADDRFRKIPASDSSLGVAAERVAKTTTRVVRVAPPEE